MRKYLKNSDVWPKKSSSRKFQRKHKVFLIMFFLSKGRKRKKPATLSLELVPHH